jgi:hypothetical protein
MRPGWNPTRRNRNIGTAKSGHGRNNRLVIPNYFQGLTIFYERLTGYRTVTRSVHGRPFSVLVEATRRRSVHPCTIDDLFQVLPHVSPPDLAGINFLVLRQPKRKEETLRPCWGRLAYWVNIGAHGGPTVILEGIEPGRPMRWSRSLKPDDAAELERLRADGHKIKATGRGHVVEPTLETARATQLYRTLLHEIGHWVDYLEHVKRPAALAPYSFLELSDRYYQRPPTEREAFAHSYAERVGALLRAAGVIPFDRLFDSTRVRRAGLDICDFTV